MGILPFPVSLFVFLFSFSSFLAFVLLGPHLRHMEVPRLGVQSELLPPAYARATATPDPSHVCDLHCNFRQCWILNPLSKARDRTQILIDTSQVLNPLSRNGSSISLVFMRDPSSTSLSSLSFSPSPSCRTGFPLVFLLFIYLFFCLLSF